MIALRRDVSLGIGLAGAAAFSVFWLPFLLPPAPAAIASASLVAGFNNRVAALSAIALACISLMLALRARPGMSRAQEPSSPPLSHRLLWSGPIMLTLWYVLLGSFAYSVDLRWMGEAHYFLEQMRTASAFHLPLYRGVEFAYGPLLFYPPLVLQPLFGFARQPLQAAYLLTLLLCIFLGALLLGWSMNQLPIAGRLRRAAYVLLLGLGAIDLGQGLNYSLLRFTLPIAALLYCLKQTSPWRMAALALIGEMLCLGISPEMGVCFAAGAISFGLLQFVGRDRRFLSVALAPPVALVLFVAIIGRAYFDTLRQFSGGTYNFIVEPQWYILVYLIELIWLTPHAVAAAWKRPHGDGPLWTAFFISGLALVPAALGRADAGHVMLNSIAILLLALVQVSHWSARRQQAWLAALIVVIAMLAFEVGSDYVPGYHTLIALELRTRIPASFRRALLRVHRPPTEKDVADFIAGVPPGPDFNPAELRQLTGGEPIATPAGLPPADEDALLKAGLAVPKYDMVDYSRVSEQRIIDGCNKQHWLLIQGHQVPEDAVTPEDTQHVLGLSYPYHSHRPAYIPGRLINADLREHWQRVATFDGLTLFHKR